MNLVLNYHLHLLPNQSELKFLLSLFPIAFALHNNFITLLLYVEKGKERLELQNRLLLKIPRKVEPRRVEQQAHLLPWSPTTWNSWHL
jgi:hypothetical protein